MRVIFLGDISTTQTSLQPGDWTAFLNSADHVVANLEGPITTGQNLLDITRAGQLQICNSPIVVDVLRTCHVTCASLANNHIFDTRQPVEQTSSVLLNAGIASFGAGPNLAEASKPCAISDSNTRVLLLGFGWKVIGCPSATLHNAGVNPLTPEHTLKTIQKIREYDRLSFVVYFMHWNYELERYPLPAERQLTRDLLEAGVDAVVGCHAHVAQGVERFGSKLAIYGLGNWFFPPRSLGNFTLKYPSAASRQMAVEFDICGRDLVSVQFHWCQFDPISGLIEYEKTEGLGGELLRQVTAYEGLSDEDYHLWFRSHRVRRRGVPIYQNYRQWLRNRLFDNYLDLRQYFVRCLIMLRLKKGIRG